MQRTVTEHAASRFAVASDPAMLRRALVVHVTRRGDAVAFDLAPGEVGHAVPTGDLFRRLVLVAEVVGEDFLLLAHASRPLGTSASSLRRKAATCSARSATTACRARCTSTWT